ncbi:Rap/ran-GAP family protein [Trichomonas vaginalis G3]|uniref:Rap/ran-GAP family protein n=1 Tax=Trichomonas vaginalis (strain ATCC PRA-98 / G3) TaxID=412133 RepID=A2DW49_TRIV3|nr:GTPase activator protein [Trichomonas vaginalis G3]EAY15350.1 Rap/ran-GAP family protein [Trichomonas vaginalis G3]KAI5496783.1 GTPase activator protein [Trichomonas vaginalis G3]|eukprot:XP_001327573.1 Rap/ran-GAP family protein [Trichomonas vaginalis G3]
MPHNAENIIKYILNQKDFVLDKFMSKMFPEFWKNMLDYARYINTKILKYKFQKSYTFKYEKIAQALMTVLPKIRIRGYSADKLTDADHFFAMMFHPESPEDTRQLFQPTYLMFLETCNSSELQFLKYSFKYYVPIPFLATGEDGKALIESFIDKQTDKILTDPNAKANIQCNVKACMKTLLMWLLNKWDKVSSNVMQLFIEKILSAAYPTEAEKTGWELPQYRLKNQLPSDVHEVLCKFFVDLFSEEHNFVALLIDKKKLCFIVELLASSLTNVSQDSTKYSIQAFAAIQRMAGLSEGFQAAGLTKKICHTTIDLFNTNPIPSTGALLSEFGFWLFRDKKVHPVEVRAKNFTITLDYAKKNDYAASIILGSFISSGLVSGEKESKIWDCLVYEIFINKLFSATAAKYMQLIATLQFPRVLDINKETIVDECTTTRHKYIRNKISTWNDIVCKNIREILDEPAKFAQNNMTIEWPSFEKYDAFLKQIPYTPCADFKTETEEIRTTTDLFLSSLDKFGKMEEIRCHVNGFAVINSYYMAFNKLKLVPADCQHSSINPFLIASRRLIRHLCVTHENEILRNGLNTIHQFIRTQDLKLHLSDQLLTDIYTIIIFCCLSANVKTAQVGFETGATMIAIGYKGSSMLVPILSKMIKYNPFDSASAVTFFSSGAVFRTPHILEENFFNYLNEKLEARNNKLVKDWKEILVKESESSIQDAVNSIEAIYKLENRNPENVITLSGNLIIDEIVQPNPNPEIVSKLISFITGIAQTFNIPALQMFQAVCQHASQLLKFCKEEFCNSIKEMASISDKIDLKTDPQFTFLFLQIMMSILVTSQTAGKNGIEKFADLINRFIKETKFPADYPPQIQQFAISSREMLAIFLGGYPFSDPVIPSSRYLKKPEQQLTLLLPNGVYLTPDKLENGGTSFTVQTKGGQFTWDMTPLTNIYEDHEMPFTFDKENFVEIPVPDKTGQSEFNKAFCDRFDTVAGTFGREYHTDVMKDDQENMTEMLDTIEKYYNNFLDEFQVKPAEKIRLNVCVEFPVAASLKALGIVEGKQTDMLKETAVMISEDENQKPQQIVPSNKIPEIMPKLNRSPTPPPKSQLREPQSVPNKPTLTPHKIIGISSQNSTPTLEMKFQAKHVDTLLYNTIKQDHRHWEKAAICYISDSPPDQTKIIQTEIDKVSPRFKEFITLLGWNVKLKEWPVYTGGLDNHKDKDGLSSIYTTNFDYELMYHVCPLMPTDPNDEQCIDKKKHIGNDAVQILFVENEKQIDPLIISSQSNTVTIIVYPLQTGLYSIDTYYRSSIKWCGPLTKPLVVRKEALNSLINSTVHIAIMSIRFAQMPYNHPLLDIDKKIQQLISEYTQPKYGGRSLYLDILLM